jgi:hypothetical protein
MEYTREKSSTLIRTLFETERRLMKAKTARDFNSILGAIWGTLREQRGTSI